MKKAVSTEFADQLEQIPNIGPAIARDLHAIGIRKPSQLKSKDPYQLYVHLCRLTRAYHDPCVLDTLISAVHFMDGKGAKPWWAFTEERKKNFHKIEQKIAQWK